MNAIRSMTGALAAALCLTALLTAPATANGDAIIVQSTTSTKNSGLYAHLLPQFKAATGITVHVVAVGTGQAIRNARNCDGDVLLVHAKAAEQKLVADGFGTTRHDLMYNDFVIVGPRADPAAIAGAKAAATALARIAASKALFASRGDDSGTHKKSARCGRPPPSTRRPRPAPGTARPAPAWARRSTSVSAWAPTS